MALAAIQSQCDPLMQVAAAQRVETPHPGRFGLGGDAMALNPDLHKRLIARQSDGELRRKAMKAIERARLWSQEEIDLADREAERLVMALGWNTPPPTPSCAPQSPAPSPEPAAR